MKKTMILLSVLLIFCLLLFHEGKADDSKDHLNLSLTKTIHIKKHGNYKIYYDLYTIKEGDWLWKILTEKYDISEEQRVDFLRILKRINPTISNADEVYPGHQIMVPVRLEFDTTKSPAETQIQKTKEHTLSPLSTNVQEYTVLPGQSLSGILIYVFNVPKHLVYNQYIELFHKLNPSIQDSNLIQANQKILIPVYMTPQKKEPETIKTEEVTPSPTVEVHEEREASLLTREVKKDQDIPSSNEIEDESPSTEEEQTVTSVPESDPQVIKDSIGAFFPGVEDRYIDKGDFHIPIPGGGDLTLDTASFPILEIESGRKIIIDFGDKLPDKIEGLIESNWKNYRIVNVQKEDTTETVFNKLLSLSDYHSVLSGDRPFVLKGKITTSIWADWVVIKSKDSQKKGTVYALNIIDKDNKGVPTAIKDYLERQGVKVIDLSLTGNQEKEQDSQEDSVREEISILKSSTNKELIQAFLNMIDQPFAEGEKLSLTKTSSGGFQMGVTADIFLRRGGSDSIISLQDLPDELVDILTDNGLRILEIGKSETPSFIISKLLRFLNIEFSSSTFQFDTVQKGHPHNISFSIPGLLLQKDPSLKILLTRANLDRGLVRFLRKKGVKAVMY
ncbi:MAG: hypothetical protein SVY10_03695 [Thermodesulfobacteriota bacterium]|nr:hypothetical protein [Thermodesulfobacteriota bacterium]